ncbi:biotin transporter BioY [Pseudoflavonifractor sp. 60]|uniref:biotin transporter BioY n=1 Tax=Pseudoflavonifractor sp. 60 TaxID=2304576 RepID=UPI00136E83CF|nr:biotin transporter BioY [Pseudoflavonifractor sp. 60]NBI69042.1 biotin transporter BioY [Pseudoflavonifractor sp. 60]
METKSNIYPRVMTAMMAAVISAVSPFALPIGPISLSLCTLVLYVAPYILGWRGSAAAALVFILLGTVGMPVFTGFQGGLGKVIGPTGGYIVGYIPLVVITGLTIRFFPRNRALQYLGMVGATAVLYTLGTIWFMFQSGNNLAASLAACVFPFIPGDLIKMAVAVVFGPELRERLVLANIHPEG